MIPFVVACTMLSLLVAILLVYAIEKESPAGAGFFCVAVATLIALGIGIDNYGPERTYIPMPTVVRVCPEMP